MLKAYFKKAHVEKAYAKKRYAKPELYPLGRATFLTHGADCTWGKKEKGANGQELVWYSNTN